MIKIRHASFLALVASLLLGGCAFTDATLKVGYADAMASRGPLATAPPRRVEVGAFADKRPETDKIGYKRNGYNQQTAKIQSEKPVPEIIRAALAAELAKNDHRPGAANPEFVLSGDVTEFWFDMRVGFFTIDFVGTTSVALDVRDPRTGTVVLSRSYRGYHKETAAGGLEGTWEQVMNSALGAMMREIGTDMRLVQALRGSGP